VFAKINFATAEATVTDDRQRRSARLSKKTGWRGGLTPEREHLPRDESVTPVKEEIFQREISTSLAIRACR
jgi:hypothetical protein